MSPTAPSTPTPTTGKDRLVALFVLAVWAGLLVHAWCYVQWFHARMPVQDDLELVPAFLPHSTLAAISELFWCLINEHRVYLSQWVHFGAVALAGDFRGGGWAQVLLLALAALAGILCARRLRGRTRFEDALFPLLLLHWSNGENLLLGTQVCVALAVLLGVLALCATVWSPGPPSVLRLSAAGLCTALLPLCGGFGLCPSPAFAAWIALCGVAAARARRFRAAWTAACACLVYAAVIALYFHEFRWPPAQPIERRLDVGLGVLVQVLSMTFGGLAPYEPWLSIPAALLLLLTACICAWQGWRRGGSGRERALGLAAGAVGALLLGASIGWTRQESWPHAGWAPRYSLAPAVLAFAAVFGVLLHGSKLVARAVPIALTVLLTVAMPFHVERGRWMADAYQSTLRPFRSAFEADLPIEELARIYGNVIYTGELGLRNRLTELKLAGLPPFPPRKHASPTEPEGVHVKPRLLASAAPPMERLVSGIPLFSVAAPASLFVELPDDARTVSGRYAVLPLAYLPVRPAEELTLGVRFRIVQVRAGSAPVELASGELHPLTRQSDRGLHEFTLQLEAGGGSLELHVESVSTERPGTDWIGFSGVTIR